MKRIPRQVAFCSGLFKNPQPHSHHEKNTKLTQTEGHSVKYLTVCLKTVNIILKMGEKKETGTVTDQRIVRYNSKCNVAS